MTEIEAKGFIQGKLDCMKKCGIFNKEDIINNDECDNCHYCYSQGNFGNQKEAFQIAINALEKQIAKKPIVHQCTTCGSAVLQFEGNYCSKCGQKLDWSDEE